MMMPLTNSTVAQELVALRNASGLSQRQLAAKLGVKQPVIAKLEAGKTRNIGLQTLVRAVKAMNGRIEVLITPADRPARAGRKGAARSRKTRRGTTGDIPRGRSVSRG